MSLTKSLLKKAIYPDLSYGIDFDYEWDFPGVPVINFRLRMNRHLLEAVDYGDVSSEDFDLYCYALEGGQLDCQCDYSLSGVNEYLVDPCIYIWPEGPCSNHCHGPFIVELSRKEQRLIMEILDEYFYRYYGGDCEWMLDQAGESLRRSNGRQNRKPRRHPERRL